MKLFNIFKPKKKQILGSEPPFVAEMRENERRFHQISKAEFSKLEDSQLLDAMLYWVHNLRWNKMVKLEDLSEPVKNAYVCFSVYGEIMNGGLNQVFFNETKYYVHLCVDGYEKIGAPEISTIIKEAMDIVTNQKGRYEALDDGTLDSFIESYVDDPLSDLDDVFYEKSDDIDLCQVITNYIRLNIDSFGN
ncbi:MAG: DMP19 family protein [Erysipelotrichaceae bacterium]|nr:DMP19 family protein [Erysipelotrichaceae bacterium]